MITNETKKFSRPGRSFFLETFEFWSTFFYDNEKRDSWQCKQVLGKLLDIICDLWRKRDLFQRFGTWRTNKQHLVNTKIKSGWAKTYQSARGGPQNPGPFSPLLKTLDEWRTQNNNTLHKPPLLMGELSKESELSCVNSLSACYDESISVMTFHNTSY